jgi:predicted dehydrogenase
MNRRELLKTAAVAAAGVSVIRTPVVKAKKTGMVDNPLGAPQTYDWKEPSEPVTAIIIGAGGRGNIYAKYAEINPKEMKVVGVAEPVELRNERMAKAYNISKENRFVTWEDIFERPKFADVCVITTPDHLHYGPAMAALEKGYDLLLEKPIAQSWKECNDILQLATTKNSNVAVCHVLRYAPYFKQMRHVVRSGQIGEVISVQHLEPVEAVHMSHSYVRGNWRKTKESNPMLLAKSCHDLDILRWIIDKPCNTVSSFGSLTLFRKDKAPAGVPKRCTDGCPVEKECPFSAFKVYLRDKKYLWHLDLPEKTDECILKALREGPYGRCVYYCDNDVVDHQVVNMQFDGGVTADFAMIGLTSYAGRRTRVFGTKGDIVGDQETLEVADFTSGKRIQWTDEAYAKDHNGHGGGDHRLVRDFIQAVSRKDPTLLTSTLAVSMESHFMGFKAEESRLNRKTICLDTENL